MRRDAGKTLGRTRAYLAAALPARAPARDQVVVAWGLVAALPGTMLAAPEAPAAAPLPALLAGVLVVASAAVCAIDSRWGLIPDPLTGLILVSGLARALLIGGPGALWPALAGTAAIYGAGRALGRLHLVWRGFEGFGDGDVKLVAAAVPWLGVAGLPAMLTVAVGSALVSIALLRLEGPVGRHDAVAFGPHLCLGLAWMAVLAPWPA